MRDRDVHEEITIGVVGGDDAVQRTMAVARTADGPRWRIVPSVYEREDDAHAHAMRIAGRVDVYLFAGPLPHDLAMRHGGLPVPADHVPVGGSALFAVLVRALVEDAVDPRRITIDSVSLEEVRTAYEEVGLDASGVHVAPYDDPASAAGFLDFHLERYRAGETTGAVTTVPTVAVALSDAGVPTLKMQPTVTAIRHALTRAALSGSGALSEESRIATMIVRIPSGVVPEHAGPSNYWYQELRLSLQAELLQLARSMDATVLPRDERSYLVVTTMGSLGVASDDLTLAPFVDAISSALSMDVEVGVGLGRSTREAEFNAETAVDKAAAGAGRAAYLVGPRGTVLRLPARRTADEQPDVPPPVPESKAVGTLRELASRLRAEGDSRAIVDAERVAALLGVTTRTARRSLSALVDEGLAWPMPPARSSRAGRPPRPYQLLVEKLDQHEASEGAPRDARPAVRNLRRT
ncbi:hypothetical protein [Nitriliruptor alkaliphilus]|uniref:hypothetical protein n=1 Tax=Nitriliruptor alkaliphilus TaxID=427918 RepID=UPI0006977C2D|nr:hypothetical protein [Nitriliruptor alkaliphilus]